jgi:hypothetical protein
MSEQDQNDTQGSGGSTEQAVTFAGLLGEGWQSSGDGIYRRAADIPEPADDLIEALQPGGEEASPIEQESPSRASTRRWLRRGRA